MAEGRAILAHLPRPPRSLLIDDNQLRLDDYLELVDQTGRIIASGKRGAIPPHLAPILQRLQIDVDAWLDVMRGRSHFLGTAVGALATLVCEATRRGVKWIAEKTRIHRDRRGRAPPGVDPALG